MSRKIVYIPDMRCQISHLQKKNKKNSHLHNNHINILTTFLVGKTSLQIENENSEAVLHIIVCIPGISSGKYRWDERGR